MVREELMDYAKRKKITGKLLVIFMITMVLLTFFSNTINNFTLPRVTLEKPSGGALIKEISGEGIIEAKLVIEEYTDTSLKVLDVNVQAGDTVRAGQQILSLDIDSLKSSLEDEKAKYQQQQISLNKLKDSSNIITLDNNIETALENLTQKTKEYQDIKTLYEHGYESEKNLKNAEAAMNTAQRSYDSSLMAKESYIKENQQDIENGQLNLEIAARRIEALEKQVANNGIYMASAGGIITEVNFSKGSMANSSKPLFKLAETSGGFQVDIPVDRDLAGYVTIGDSVDVRITSLGDKVVKGAVAQIKEELQNGDNKVLVIDVNDQELQGGEKGQIYISNKTKQYSALVPNSSVYTDNNGYYVFVIKKNDGPLGTENYVQRADVTVEDSDSTMSAIVNGIMPMDKIVTDSTKSLSDGDKVVVVEQ
ncbi:multidrug resistance protein MdtA [Oxobacter pfennigii]|uniref:Multidrug resistance protein MdtA n=1 Tax=Oxobacter pfennigii TaxID=36849 RepID=A0A0P8WBU8_9CLOT|nr:efflux RND transporter periplasmic adaptor subunit [Oxobacter pfennigii]KPU46146.1 multidrug resistance protein MdtA [Oxobacter pfennigii]